MDVRSPAPSPRSDELVCRVCNVGKLEFIEERPHPLFGILGMTLQTLKCTCSDCAQLTLI